MCKCSETNNTISNVTCLYALAQEQEEICCILSHLLNAYAQLIVCGVGLFFNSITVLLFFDETLSSVFFNRLLLCLAITDNIYLVATILELWIFSHQNLHFYHACAFYFVIYPARNITMCCTIYMTVMLALERYNAIVKSQTNPQMIRNVSWTRVLKFTLPVILFCTLFKIPNFLEFGVEKGRDDDQQLLSNTSIVLAEHTSTENTYNITTRIIVSNMRSDELYVLLYTNIANIILTGLLPFTLLAFLNFHIYKGVKRLHQRRVAILSKRPDPHATNNQKAKDKSQAIILFAIVLIFLLCHILRIFLNVEDWLSHKTRFEELAGKGCKYGVPYWALVATPISETLLRVNSSLNFFIYCAFNKSFRDVISGNVSKMLNACGILKPAESESMTNNFENQELQPKQMNTNTTLL